MDGDLIKLIPRPQPHHLALRRIQTYRTAGSQLELIQSLVSSLDLDAHTGTDLTVSLTYIHATVRHALS